MAEFIDDPLCYTDDPLSSTDDCVDTSPASPKREPFRAGDVVKHLPSGEEWLLACDEHEGRVMPCGWPQSAEPAADVVIVRSASDDERLQMLRQVADAKERGGTRAHRARVQLGIIASPVPARHPFRAGDVVRHIETNNQWSLAADEQDGRVMFCEWPKMTLPAAHVVIMRRASDAERLSRLKEVAEIQERALERLTGPGHYDPAPIPMLLPCFKCYALHIDEGEWATKPHKTHKCQHCGYEWRPANVPTVGVRCLPSEAAPAPKPAPDRITELQAASTAAVERRRNDLSYQVAEFSRAFGYAVHHSPRQPPGWQKPDIAGLLRRFGWRGQ